MLFRSREALPLALPEEARLVSIACHRGATQCPGRTLDAAKHQLACPEHLDVNHIAAVHLVARESPDALTKHLLRELGAGFARTTAPRGDDTVIGIIQRFDATNDYPWSPRRLYAEVRPTKKAMGSAYRSQARIVLSLRAPDVRPSLRCSHRRGTLSRAEDNPLSSARFYGNDLRSCYGVLFGR